MKELTIQQKAKAYDEAIKEATIAHKDEDKHLKATLERIFPQIKESDDEKIRKNCIHFLELQKSHHASTVEIDECIAWLEQQGKSALETIKEEKVDNANKAEPKFKIGDWVVSPNGVYWHIDAIKNGRYQVSSNSGISTDWPLDTKNYHKFTIKDAKDGDVLVHSSFIFIYNSTSILQAYCYYSRNRFIIEDRGHHCPWNMQEVTPATKEQHDILMKAMAHAKYTFDFEKKELKKIEQKSNDKVEPKFKVGDYVVDNCGYVWRIEGILNEFYILEGIDGGESRPTIEWVNKTFHLWDITKDAKDGDVLVVDNMIFIYKRTLANHIISYCKLINDVFESTSDARTCCEGNTHIHPATKEQRELLEKAMANAGYTFDKKELKKIEKNPAWSEEDERTYKGLNNLIYATQYCDSRKEFSDWLKSLKERVQPQQKQEWSEEDKGTLERIISFINSFVDKDLGEVVLNEEIFTDDAQQELKRYVDFLRNIKSIFPELKESGDERIRKELIAHCENLSEMFHIIDKKEDFVKYQSWIAWLEKQGKQKPTENSNKHSDWNEEDEKMFGYALDMIEWYSDKNEDKSRLVSDWLKSIKYQKQF